ncbi:FtsJ-like methyltransferase family protein [Metarhizium album ARSEF 1941]|uniref:FtsJ-like methyltransferase family protein n=1 Tax=Metarhizium album (strain ARSEF 1941) TaxID=1081103 RepID=A0A0B2WS03_METAS|nr:FtsJ-like methyltransferase family protein [Metarhizium album ARSEF 1941]KHN96793.1 FtsJ-like methyltransferase family protein [Metarhizium album ARSEF 1941]
MSDQTGTLVPPCTAAEKSAQPALTAEQVLRDYLKKNSPRYRELCEIRKEVIIQVCHNFVNGCLSSSPIPAFANQRQVSEDTAADEEYARRRFQKTVKPQTRQQKAYLDADYEACNDLNDYKQIFKILKASSDPSVLDMGIAQGGFAKSVLNRCGNVKVKGISMPSEEGGPSVLFKHKRLSVVFQNVGKPAGHPGESSAIPDKHPAAKPPTLETLLETDELYDLVFCHSKPVRGARSNQGSEGNEQPAEKEPGQSNIRGSWNKSRDCRRLRLAELVIGMEHLKDNGTMVVSMRKLDTLDTALLIKCFKGFSKVSLFKPEKSHQKTASSFLVAQNIRTRGEKAAQAIRAWNEEWQGMILKDAGVAAGGSEDCADEVVENARQLVQEFGKTLVNVTRVPCSVQARALRLFLEMAQKRSSRRAAHLNQKRRRRPLVVESVGSTAMP